MIYNNPLPGQREVYTCPLCHGVFIRGNVVCAVMHYGQGCCHYGDEPQGILPNGQFNVEEAIKKLSQSK